MTKFVAFLRAVNLGGDSTVRMGDLVTALERDGLGMVRTFRASGNVAFDAAASESGAQRIVEGSLRRLLRGDYRAFVRTAAELAEIRRRDPFAGQLPDAGTPYVTFLDRAPARPDPLPFVVSPGHITVLAVEGREVFTLGRRVGSKIGFPNEFVERFARAPATSRNWSTVVAFTANDPPAGRRTDRPARSGGPRTEGAGGRVTSSGRRGERSS